MNNNQFDESKYQGKYVRFGDLQINDFVFTIHPDSTTVEDIKKYKVHGIELKPSGVSLKIYHKFMGPFSSTSSKLNTRNIECSQNKGAWKYSADTLIVSDPRLLYTVLKNNLLTQHRTSNSRILNLLETMEECSDRLSKLTPEYLLTQLK